ncbi:MAG: potassium transporter Kup [Desulfuromonadales bacterium GWC2_61_20]|nr:MAG: potassium transporter Kup [Desulfuromonadales bacterium GWC2_61_20]HBT82571.1 potassium transporter Kup [Desulfuromonas sp.]
MSASPTAAPRGRYLLLLSLATLGVVYGDIGTSPLYALRECFHRSHGLAPTADNVLGVLSLIVWALIIVVSVKYVAFILRADNRGEGGVLSLTALVMPSRSEGPGSRWGLIVLGLFGAALLYGDGMITPAISVLSAVEGLELATPAITPFVIPITVAIIIALFVCQQRGTGGIGVVFGPVMLLWFGVIALLGLIQIWAYPQVLSAISPHHAVSFFLRNGGTGFLVLGSVVLVVTGGEALYADMGHFGTRPIRLVWFCLVLPALLLNYFGQGALLLAHPANVENPFFLLAPTWALIPLVLLATAATVIASQALISGAFSLSMQAVQLGFSPRLDIEHTSAREKGQIYLPGVNWILMLCCIGLVVGFRSSSNLAAAYGIAVTATMAVTTCLFFFFIRDRWGWPLSLSLLVCGTFLLADLAFFGANIVKIAHGGWFPLVIGVIIFTLMATWKRGRSILSARMREGAMALDLFTSSIAASPPHRVPGTAVFMSGNLDIVPSALLHNLKHNKVLHQRVVFLSVLTESSPHVPPAERADLTPLAGGMYRIVLRYGFMDEPNVPAALAALELDGWRFSMMETTFFLGRETVIPSAAPGMALWRERLFMLMSRNSRTATDFFGLPPNRVVELGLQVEI